MSTSRSASSGARSAGGGGRGAAAAPRVVERGTSGVGGGGGGGTTSGGEGARRPTYPRGPGSVYSRPGMRRDPSPPPPSRLLAREDLPQEAGGRGGGGGGQIPNVRAMAPRERGAVPPARIAKIRFPRRRTLRRGGRARRRRGRRRSRREEGRGRDNRRRRRPPSKPTLERRSPRRRRRRRRVRRDARRPRVDPHPPPDRRRLHPPIVPHHRGDGAADARGTEGPELRARLGRAQARLPHDLPAVGSQGPRPTELLRSVLRRIAPDFAEHARLLDRAGIGRPRGFSPPRADRRSRRGHPGRLPRHLLRRPRVPLGRHPRRLSMGSNDRVLAQLRPGRGRTSHLRLGPARGHAQPLATAGDEVDLLRGGAVLHHHHLAGHTGRERGVRQLRPEVQPSLPVELRVLRRAERGSGRVLSERGPAGGGAGVDRGGRRRGALGEEVRVLDEGGAGWASSSSSPPSSRRGSGGAAAAAGAAGVRLRGRGGAAPRDRRGGIPSAAAEAGTSAGPSSEEAPGGGRLLDPSPSGVPPSGPRRPPLAATCPAKRVRVCASNNENARALFGMLRTLACDEREIDGLLAGTGRGTGAGVGSSGSGAGAGSGGNLSPFYPPGPAAAQRLFAAAGMVPPSAGGGGGSPPSSGSPRTCRDVRHPLSLRNERRALELLLEAVARQLAGYPTSLARDRADLSDEGAYPPYSNARNAKLQVRGEKEVLHHYATWARTGLEVLDVVEREAEDERAAARSAAGRGRVAGGRRGGARATTTASTASASNDVGGEEEEAPPGEYDALILAMEDDDDCHNTVLRYCSDVLGLVRREELERVRAEASSSYNVRAA